MHSWRSPPAENDLLAGVREIRLTSAQIFGEWLKALPAQRLVRFYGLLPLVAALARWLAR